MHNKHHIMIGEVQHYCKCLYIVLAFRIVLHSPVDYDEQPDLDLIIQEPCSVKKELNSLPDDKILDCSKLKRIADILKCI